MLGSTDVPTVSAFMTAFEQQHFNPKIFIAAAGPDQGSAFTSAVGAKNANGMMVPDAWYPGMANPRSKAMVQAYVAKFGGSPSAINADVAEAYSVGEVVDQAVTHLRSLSNAKIISLPAQRRHAAERAGPGQVQRAGGEPGLPPRSSSSGSTASSSRFCRPARQAR